MKIATPAPPPPPAPPSPVYTPQPVACRSLWLRASESPSLLMEPLIHHRSCSKPSPPPFPPSLRRRRGGAALQLPLRAALQSAHVHSPDRMFSLRVQMEGFTFQCKGQPASCHSAPPTPHPHPRPPPHCKDFPSVRESVNTDRFKGSSSIDDTNRFPASPAGGATNI